MNVKMYLKQVKVGPYENFNYLLGPDGGKEAAVVDPAFEVDRLISIADGDGRSIVKVLLTHTHPDHIEGLAGMVSRTGAEVYVHPLELERARQALISAGLDDTTIHKVEDGVEVTVGDLKGRVIHTAGHTPGGVCYLFGEKLITGDTLFVGGCGRCDLSGGDPKALYDSLYGRLIGLPEDTEVFCGHDYGDMPVSTLARERRSNPYLKWNGVEEFVQYRMVGYLKDKISPGR